MLVVATSLPRPNWPKLFRPQAQMRPSVVRPSEWLEASTASQVRSGATATGRFWLAELVLPGEPMVPWPSWPKKFAPQAQSEPLVLMARLWTEPASITAQSESVPI